MAQSALPGIFTYSNTSQGIMQNQDFRLNGPAATPRGGTAVIVYLTGIGLVDNTIAPGAVTSNSPLSRSLARFTATIGGRPAEVLFAGYSPGSIGLAQVNVLVPSGLTGAQQSVLFANNITSAPVLVYVAP